MFGQIKMFNTTAAMLNVYHAAAV